LSQEPTPEEGVLIRRNYYLKMATVELNCGLKMWERKLIWELNLRPETLEMKKKCLR